MTLYDIPNKILKDIDNDLTNVDQSRSQYFMEHGFQVQGYTLAQ